MATIDENLIRNELSELERAEALARRKELYEAKFPEARAEEQRKKELKQYRAAFDAAREEVPAAFTADTAVKTGLTPRTIQKNYIGEVSGGKGL